MGAEQGTQSFAPDALPLPFGHTRQASAFVSPSFALCVPGEHGSIVSGDEQYDPFGQGDSMLLPAGQ